jgi:hypothetical protein
MGGTTGAAAAGLSLPDTLRVGGDQWIRYPESAQPLWERLEHPGSSDPLGGLVRLEWIDFVSERAHWAPEPAAARDLAAPDRCLLAGGPAMLETGGAVTVRLAIDPATALPAEMRVEIDNTVGSDARLDYAIAYGVKVDVRAPVEGEEASPAPAGSFELRVYNRGGPAVRVLVAAAASSSSEPIDFGVLSCGPDPLVIRPGLNGLPAGPWTVLLEYPGADGAGGIDVGDDGTGPKVLVITVDGATAGPAGDLAVPTPGPCPPQAPPWTAVPTDQP